MPKNTYRFIKAPPGYPGKVYSFGKRALEHHVVWWQNTGSLIPAGHVAHHINELKYDNRFENLELLSEPEHTKRHHVKTVLSQVVVCAGCGKEFTRPARNVRFKTSLGHKLFCSRDCSKTHPRPKPLPAHGAYGRYRKGCRCDLCKEANTVKMRAYVASKKTKGL